MTTRVLAIDTATEACSAAILVEGAVYERFLIAPRRHSALILPMVEEVMAEAGVSLRQLDGLCFGRGPGSFTGVRIAAGVIQGLALASDLPVAPVSTLAALAQGAFRPDGPECIVAAFDARMGEVYLGIYTMGGIEAPGATGICAAATVQPLRPEAVIDPAAISASLPGAWTGVGSGFKTHGAALCKSLAGSPSRIEPETYPHARDVALLGLDTLRQGRGVRAEEALPVYLRDRVPWGSHALGITCLGDHMG
ncbi:MAG: tRNA (adenosine(37)-N6)-threonylcarbamoyltransferase complex dimerization subunit type 1 TsaB [Gammaproteobacteria bacterium]